MPSPTPVATSIAALKILMPAPGGRRGSPGSFMSATLTQVRAPPGGLSLAGAALLLQAAFAARLRRLGGPAAARHVQCAREALPQPLERQLAVARLAARVLCHGRHARPAAGHDAALLLLAE